MLLTLLIAGWYALTSPLVLLLIGEASAAVSGQPIGSLLSTKMTPGGIVVLVARTWINFGLSVALVRARESAVGWSTAIVSFAVLGAVLALPNIETQDDLIRFAGGIIATAGAALVLVYCRHLRARGLLH